MLASYISEYCCPLISLALFVWWIFLWLCERKHFFLRMWFSLLLSISTMIFLQLHGWKHYLCTFCMANVVLPSCLIIFIPSCIHQSWEFSWSEHDCWFGWWSDICCWTCPHGGPAENTKCNTAIRFQLEIIAFEFFRSIYFSENLHSPGLSGAAADPGAGKCHSKLLHYCYCPNVCIIFLLVL